MPSNLNIFFPPEDMAAIQEQIQRRHKILGDSPEACIRIGFIAACKSLRASTKEAPRRRKVRQIPSTRRVRKEGNKLFFAEGLNRTTGGLKNIMIWAPSLALAKLSPKAQIVKHGLGKDSWGWAMHRLFQQPSPGNAATVTPPGTLDVTKIFDRTTGYAEATVVNKLNYISHALSGGRGPAVSTALQRASASMRKVIDQKIDAATRAAGY